MPNRTPLLLALGFISLCLLLLWDASRTRQQRDDFKRTHHCRLVESFPTREAWLCNDGVKYWWTK